MEGSGSVQIITDPDGTKVLSVLRIRNTAFQQRRLPHASPPTHTPKYGLLLVLNYWIKFYCLFKLVFKFHKNSFPDPGFSTTNNWEKARNSVPDPWHFGTDPDPRTYGSGSCSFRQWPPRYHQTHIFFSNFFAYLFMNIHLNHSSKI